MDMNEKEIQDAFIFVVGIGGSAREIKNGFWSLVSGSGCVLGYLVYYS